MTAAAIIRSRARSSAGEATRRRRRWWITLVLLAWSLPAAADTLVWSDEFDGARLDTTVWQRQVGDGTGYGLPSGWGNEELQHYTDSDRSSFVADGVLHIVARRSEAGAFTSARLRTMHRRDVLYGRIEARIEIPAADGMWSAFWMMPADSPYGGWAACGEIDIMEIVGHADAVHGTLHFGGEWPDNTFAGGHRPFADKELSEAFHVYGVEWTPDEIRWYVDGEMFHAISSDAWTSTADPDNPRAPFDQPFHLVLNLAVGGHWPGPPDEDTPFPQTMRVDWVRIWKMGPEPAPNVPPRSSQPD